MSKSAFEKRLEKMFKKEQRCISLAEEKIRKDECLKTLRWALRQRTPMYRDAWIPAYKIKAEIKKVEGEK